MLNPEDRAAWTDAYEEAIRREERQQDKKPGWYGTAFAIATGLVTLWALYGKLPIN